jgi:hypothetical protein
VGRTLVTISWHPNLARRLLFRISWTPPSLTLLIYILFLVQHFSLECISLNKALDTLEDPPILEDLPIIEDPSWNNNAKDILEDPSNC